MIKMFYDQKLGNQSDKRLKIRDSRLCSFEMWFQTTLARKIIILLNNLYALKLKYEKYINKCYWVGFLLSWMCQRIFEHLHKNFAIRRKKMTNISDK